MKAVGRAPGKVIIAGEHFVVHGSRALVASIDRYVTVEAFFHEPGYIKSEELGEIAPLKSPSERLAPIAVSVSPLLKGREVALVVKSEIPVSSGLGSSAATCVAAVKAVEALLGLELKHEDVYELAMRGESLVHGRPSGVDVAISVWGGFMVYRRGERPQPLSGAAELAICNTKIGRKTGDMVAKVSKFGEERPELFSSLIKAVDLIVDESVDALKAEDHRKLGMLMNFNHEALRLVGASIPELDRVVYGSRPFCFGSKLTGAGGGGCTIHLIDPKKKSALMDYLKSICPESMAVRAGAQGATCWRVEDG